MHYLVHWIQIYNKEKSKNLYWILIMSTKTTFVLSEKFLMAKTHLVFTLFTKYSVLYQVVLLYTKVNKTVSLPSDALNLQEWWGFFLLFQDSYPLIMITFNSSSNNNTFISVCLSFLNDKDIFVVPVSMYMGCVYLCVCVCVCVCIIQGTGFEL